MPKASKEKPETPKTISLRPSPSMERLVEDYADSAMLSKSDIVFRVMNWFEMQDESVRLAVLTLTKDEPKPGAVKWRLMKKL